MKGEWAQNKSFLVLLWDIAGLGIPKLIISVYGRTVFLEINAPFFNTEKIRFNKSIFF